MRNINQTTHCANCGAPATTEICPYCHVATGIDAISANMEYPVIECKEVNLHFWNVGFPMIFAISFGYFGIMSCFIMSKGSTVDGAEMFYCGFIFLAIGIVALMITLIPIIRYLQVKRYGKEIEAAVYGYLNDNILINNQPAQIVKLLVDTNDGKKFILYQLGDTVKPFKINSTIKLNVYKNLFMIKNKKQYYF